jgi:hypothetical protein
MQLEIYRMTPNTYLKISWDYSFNVFENYSKGCLKKTKSKTKKSYPIGVFVIASCKNTVYKEDYF